MKYFALLLLGMVLASCTSNNTDNELRLRVEAGEIDRHHSLISFQLPDTMESSSYQLVDSAGNKLALQVEGKRGYFILPELKAGEHLTFQIMPSKQSKKSKICFRFGEDDVSFYINRDIPVLHYRTGSKGAEMGGLDSKFARGGYIHPVMSPQGEVITEHYNPDRPHQNGIWSGWSKVEVEGRKPDFWTPMAETGSVEVDYVEKVWSGPVYGGLRSVHRFVDQTTEEDIPVLSEHWTLRVHNTDKRLNNPVFVFDLDAEQTNITASPFTIHEHVYGGIGFRGNDSWLGEENTTLLTSEGKTRTDGEPLREVWSHVQAHQSRAKWAYLSGIVGDKRPGIIILVHPENTEFPEPIFMNLREPFFTFSPAVMRDTVLAPGESLRLRYRYVTLDGEPDAEYIEALWQDYAHPAEVAVYSE